MSSIKAGTVYLVGAGPGDPGLLTVRAAQLIGQADAIVHDQLVGPDILEMAAPACERYDVGKRAGRHSLPQCQINALLVRLGRDGRRVVRLKGGDPLVFGRGAEEAEYLLSAGVACEIVPGITAALGAAACVGIPLTHRDHAQTCVLATGHCKDGGPDLDWSLLARPNQTLVVYMGLASLEVICCELIAHGLAATTPAALVRSATLPDQQELVGTLATLAGCARRARFKAPALLFIGTVIGRRWKPGPRAAVRTGPEEEHVPADALVLQ
jgi:uroporphyrin-III C-methyltransferase